MSIADKLTQIAENEPKVYDAGEKAGKQSEYNRFWDAFQKNGARTNYWYGFSGYGWTKENLKPKYKITFNEAAASSQTASGMFYRAGGNDWNNSEASCFDFSIIQDKFDFSGLKGANDLFNSSHFINIYADLSNCETTVRTFARSWGGYMNNITLKVSEKLTNCASMFEYGGSITNLTFTEDSVIACNGMNFGSCPLTHASLESIINALQNKNAIGATGSITFGTTNLNNLTDADRAALYEKGWSFT